MRYGHGGLRSTVAGCLLAGAVAVGWPGTATAVTAVGPFCDTAAKVTSTTYFTCTSGTHSALDVGGVACGTPLRAPLVGTHYYRFYGGCANTCSGSTCNGGAGNYYGVTGSSGWDFRILHLNADANSFSKSCDRCLLGQVGGTGSVSNPHVHFDNRQYGTRKTSWYTSSGTTCGSSGYCGNVLGSPTL